MAAREALDRPGRQRRHDAPARPRRRRAACSRRSSITERSVLGALAVHTGGLSIDHGWLRVHGGRVLLDWREQSRRRADRRPRRRRRLLRRRPQGRRGPLPRARHARVGGHGDGARRLGALGADRRRRRLLREPALAGLGGGERAARARRRADPLPAAVLARGPRDRRRQARAGAGGRAVGRPAGVHPRSSSATDAPPPAARAVLPRRRDHALRQARRLRGDRARRAAAAPRDRLRQRRRRDRRRAGAARPPHRPVGAAGG